MRLGTEVAHTRTVVRLPIVRPDFESDGAGSPAISSLAVAELHLGLLGRFRRLLQGWHKLH